MESDVLSVDLSEERRRTVGFVKKIIKGARAKGVAVGLSGGVDSAVTGAVCVEALGKKKVLCLLMPSEHTPQADLEDARALAKAWEVEVIEVPIDGIAKAFGVAVGKEGTRIAKANVLARVRMTIIYYFANSRGLLVAGTGDRSELELGFYTKWGDGGADFLPLAHLYKTQVRALGKELGLPRRVVYKPASPQLWKGHRAEDELPAGYGKLDLVLHYLLEEGYGPAKAAARASVPVEVAEKALKMHEASEHKRRLPPSLYGK